MKHGLLGTVEVAVFGGLGAPDGLVDFGVVCGQFDQRFFDEIPVVLVVAVVSGDLAGIEDVAETGVVAGECEFQPVLGFDMREVVVHFA